MPKYGKNTDSVSLLRQNPDQASNLRGKLEKKGWLNATFRSEMST